MACLYLIPNTLDLGCDPQPLTTVLPLSVIEQAARLQHWVVEDAKSARAFLKRVDALSPLCVPLQAMDLRVLPRPQADRRHGAAGGAGGARNTNEAADVQALLGPLQAGQDMGLLSEAGLPAVADPGAWAVAQAHRLGATVMPMSGPNSMMLALAASGLNGQSFAFIGYLPQDAAARAARLRELHQRSQREQQTQLLIETPYRNDAVMKALLEHLPPSTRLSVAHGLTLPQGWCRTATVAAWRQSPPLLDKGVPTVFGFLA